MKLAFIEMDDEIEPFTVYCRNNNINLNDVKIVALSIKVQSILKRKSIPYENTLSFFDNISHESCLLESDKIVKLLESKLIIDITKDNLTFHKRYYIFLIRHMVNYIIWLIEIITNAIDYYNVSSIITGVYDKSNYHGPFVRDDESYMEFLCDGVASSKGIRYEKFKVKCKNKDIKENKNRNILKRLLNIMILRKRIENNIILILGLHYNLSEVIDYITGIYPKLKTIIIKNSKLKELIRSYLGKNLKYYTIDLESLPSRDFKEMKYDLLSFSNILKECKCFVYKDLDYGYELNNKINNGIKFDTNQLINDSSKLYYYLDKYKPSLSISVMSRGIFNALGEICSKLKLNAISISHGTVVPPKNSIEEITNKNVGLSVILNKYPAVAIQTPWAQKFMQHYKHSSETIRTGPLVFTNKIKKSKHNNIVNILHATTLKARHSMKFWAVETEDELINSLTSLINIISNKINIKLFIKFHPGFDRHFDLSNVSDLLPECNNYDFTNKNVRYELSKCDLLVSYSSTVIEEALINRIPVLLYDKWNRYKHFNALDLSIDDFQPYPVYYVNSSNILNKYFDKIISEGINAKIDDSVWSNYHYDDYAIHGFNNYLRKCLV